MPLLMTRETPSTVHAKYVFLGHILVTIWPGGDSTPTTPFIFRLHYVSSRSESFYLDLVLLVFCQFSCTCLLINDVKMCITTKIFWWLWRVPLLAPVIFYFFSPFKYELGVAPASWLGHCSVSARIPNAHRTLLVTLAQSTDINSVSICFCL